MKLLDVNLLIALHDPKHVGHDLAHNWFEQEGQYGWATCPLTENGFLRIVTQEAYPNRVESILDAIFVLENMIRNYEKKHYFWSDNISLRDHRLFKPEMILGHRQLTDIYLLGLCQKNGGTLVTLDTSIHVTSIQSPHSELILTLSI
ncbi:MAG: VapC toxin family PIN domain ribonuclease [Fimbriimonadia bacterium]|nr:VapC toxin family PIN domain ribonuclease [Fimbriimonadia bacterium]